MGGTVRERLTYDGWLIETEDVEEPEVIADARRSRCRGCAFLDQEDGVTCHVSRMSATCDEQRLIYVPTEKGKQQLAVYYAYKRITGEKE